MKQFRVLTFIAFIATLASPASASAPTGSFVGILPCADCPGIDYRLDLFDNGVYYVRRTYHERDGRFDEVGNWRMSPGGNELTLIGSDGEQARLAVEATDKLTLLDREGRRIDSAFNHSLYRSNLLAPISPRVTIDGLFTYFADSAMLEDCNTGRRMPVAMEADYIRLERAWLNSGRSIEQPMPVRVDARIVERVNMEGPLRPTVIVERHVGMAPDGTCTPRPTQTPRGSKQPARLDGEWLIP